ncbi:MAG: carboxypeptidase-like regulatory domain-containing protein [Oscillospiraceae bacterium]|nr:carboxypeptidase-like regulatory domain-containing protein [Oscillospiraceae bacterium]
MADIKQDILSLSYSPSFEVQGMQEADINLSLPPASVSTATVYGTVTDGTAPLPNATVKLFDSLGVPYQHTMTDASGAYTLNNIPAGTYSIAAVADGYLMSPSAGVILTDGITVEVPLVCAVDATLSLGAVAGVVSATGATGPVPLAGAKLTLMDAQGVVLASTYSADDGEFVFYDLADGIYRLMASAEGYVTTGAMTVTVTGGSLSNVTVTMATDARTYSGTVSGVVRNALGSAVAGCFVGLYQVTKDTQTGATTEKLVAVTKTNAEGKYLFGGVSGGQYLVKAKLEQ